MKSGTLQYIVDILHHKERQTMKKMQKIPLALILTICLIFVYIPAFADDPNGPGFGTPDSNPPVLHSISINKIDVTAPSTIQVTAQVTDDISGVGAIYAYFENAYNGRKFSLELQNHYYDEDLHKDITLPADEVGGKIKITQFEPTGLFELNYVDCYDIAENKMLYRSKNYPDIFESSNILPNELSFFVHNTDEGGGSHDFGITTPDLADKIGSLPEGETANIAFGNASKLPATVFDAIKGKDKAIALTGNGIQWIFNGKDINASKDIDLSVDIFESTSDGYLWDMVGGENLYTITFADNDQLPGKAKIRIKADAAMKSALGQSNVYIYYYDKQNGKLVNIASNITVTSDSYFEFEITHCSDYVMTKGPAKNPSGSTDPDPDPTPDPAPSPNPVPDYSINSGSGGGGSGGSRRSSSSSSQSNKPMLNPKQTINALLGKTGFAPGTTASSYGTIDLDRSANDLTMAYIASLNLPREQMAAYYVEHYTELYQQFRNELQTAMK